MKLQTETLYLLSGPPGAGKSTFVKGCRLAPALPLGELRPLPPGTVQSSDALRMALFGSDARMVEGRAIREPRSVDDTLIFATLERAVAVRMQERLTTIVDAMLLRDSDRMVFAKHALANGMDVQVLLFDTPRDEVSARNRVREVPVPETSLDRAFEQFERSSQLPLHVMSPADIAAGAIIQERRSIPETHGLDVIGDVHGLLQPLLDLLFRLGYALDETPAGVVPRHPDGRKLLFLGDLCDRGPHSVEVLELVMRAVQTGGHFAITGNHERKLLKFLQAYADSALKSWSSTASATTGLAVLRLAEERRTPLVKFLKSLPAYYVRGRVAFVHADIGAEFVPGDITVGTCAYGVRMPETKLDTDALTRQANPHFYVVRGHIPQTSEGPGVVSLYERAEYGGHLVAMSLPAAPIDWPEQLDQAPRVRVATGFNYREVLGSRPTLYKDLAQLVKENLVTATTDLKNGLTLFKYAKSVFYNNLWHQHPALLRARGIVFNLALEVVQNPFTKVFNFGENGTTLPKSQVVVAATKMNGFLACVSRHPVERDRLLITTTGSFDSKFVDLVKDSIKKNRAMGPILRELREQPGLTLMFEVVHPEDPHIVQYSEHQHGLYLIGARACEPIDSVEWTESELDAMAARMGPAIQRESWERLSFGALLDKARTATNAEGWMVRADDAGQQTLMKLKTPWYLTTKFLGRMTEGNVNFMFKNPPVFKQKLDEEFYPLVDRLTEEVTLAQYLAMAQADRVQLVAALTREMVSS